MNKYWVKLLSMVVASMMLTYIVLKLNKSGHIEFGTAAILCIIGGAAIGALHGLLWPSK